MFGASKTKQVSSAANYIEDVFSTWLSTGDNSSSRAIVNGIDLATKGGLVWGKRRDATGNNQLYDTARGVNKYLITNDTGGQGDISPDGVNAFNTNGFSTGVALNTSPYTYAYWTFRKQPKFFDVVTYTGNGVAGRTVSHNLGSIPGCIIVKNLSTPTQWLIYHTSLGNTKYLLFTTDAAGTGSFAWNNTSPTSTDFTVGTSPACNTNGDPYVAYIFAHDAGGFGLTGTDNVISCGSVVGASQVEVNLGYEPQWILVKNASAAQDWWVVDNMRGLPVQATDTSYNASALRPNLSDAETTGFSIAPSATGFKANVLTSGQTYIYIAIRRGPMKVPTDATKVFSPVANTQSSGTVRTIGFPADLAISSGRTTNLVRMFNDRLRGFSSTNTAFGPRLFSNDTAAESSSYTGVGAVTNTGYQDGDYFDPGISMIRYLLGRAPSFFDEVCYQWDGTATRNVQHNLGVAPEMYIVKRRNAADTWMVRHKDFFGTNNSIILNSTAAAGATGVFTTAGTTSTTFPVANDSSVNASGGTYVAYLFATCAGVSKVGSYTGNGTTQTINCGFAGGARFVLIKRTDSTGDWYVYDTARGMTTLTDPYLLLNSTAAETATLGSVTTVTTGFAVNASILAAINTNAATYIFLAIA